MAVSARTIVGRVVFVRDIGRNGPGDAEVITRGGHRADGRGPESRAPIGDNEI